MTKDEALRLALWALDSVLANHKGAPVLPWIEARDAVKAALAQTEQKRPQNCGTGYCSCIECVMEPPQRKENT